ncbi:MAG TPA: HD domain-containing phosphohydrolase [Thermoleophilaceae bacterium]|nr:HD domain-containing phosphohydrolase [Thermoleophilaceae bacterium]
MRTLRTRFRSDDSKADALSRVPLLAGLRRGELCQLATHAEDLDVPAGAKLYREGETAREFFIVMQGEVEISKDGERVTCLSGGDFCGQIALIERAKRASTATALTPVRFFVVTQGGFAALLARNPVVERRALHALVTENISERRIAETSLRRQADLNEHQAMHDSLTGLPNRRKLMIDLERAMGSQKETEAGLLALFDLDGFKSYNDTFGHAEGDLLLRRLSAKLADVTGGRAYRLGGDEFCALLAGEATGNGLVAAACMGALSEDGEGFSIRTSAGFVEFPSEAAAPTSALLIADQRMYAEKEGRAGSAKQQTRDMILRVLEERHPDLHDHVSAVAAAARRIGVELGLSRGELEDLVRAAELHDIGKIAIPDAILHKAGSLDEEEWRFMRRHTIIGESMLSAAPALATAAKAVRSSHERFDGAGYPDGLAGEDVPLASRIIFICDSFHAMTSARPYQQTLDPVAALAELRRCAGTQFDPSLFEVFEQVGLPEPAAPKPRPAPPRSGSTAPDAPPGAPVAGFANA